MIQIEEVGVMADNSNRHNPLETGHDSDAFAEAKKAIEEGHNPLETGHDSDGGNKQCIPTTLSSQSPRNGA